MTTEMNTDALALSDEEFLKLPMPTAGAVVVAEANEPMETEGTEEAESAEQAEGSGEALGASTTDDQEDKAPLPSDEEKAAENAPEKAGEAGADNPQDGKKTGVEVIDYKALYEQVIQPFKANGKEMTVDTVEDIRQLMQMGANYNKKMVALKPNLKIVKMLENSGLLDEEKLGYLIDLSKHNPDAIKRLLKESNMDPLDIDMSAESQYKPNTYSVNDKEMELDAVLADIRETSSYNTTLDIIGNKWDDSSKRILVDHPDLIKVINTHVGNGVYEAITNEVERLRTLGRLNGVSDIDAYKAVGDFLYAPKEANAQKPGNYVNTTTTYKATVHKEDVQLNDKRKAASSTKGVVSNKKPDFNPLAMSDEEFEKVASSRFI